MYWPLVPMRYRGPKVCEDSKDVALSSSAAGELMRTGSLRSARYISRWAELAARLITFTVVNRARAF